LKFSGAGEDEPDDMVAEVYGSLAMVARRGNFFDAARDRMEGDVK
jgi:hypothetical protein